jgi:hypothetical protein
MKMMRMALFFGVGIYLGLHAENFSNMDVVAETIRDLVDQARRFR